jgi:DNA-binding response OmpR family regulator
VDDEEGLLELYRTSFSREGYEVEVAATLDAARDRLASGGVDLVVLDIRMAEGSGLVLLRAIKSGPHRVPVVLSTAYARYQDDFTSWLADAYVVKSSDLAELKATVRRCLERMT